MSNEELIALVNRFHSEHGTGKASFGIFQYGGGTDENYIRANRDGLILYARSILQAAISIRETEQPGSTIPFDLDGSWVDPSSTSFIGYVEPINGGGVQVAAAPKGRTNVLASAGCAVLGVLILVALVVGLYNVFTWIF